MTKESDAFFVLPSVARWFFLWFSLEPQIKTISIGLKIKLLIKRGIDEKLLVTDIHQREGNDVCRS